MPEVSVIVPVYNMEQYLENCIKSIQAQDYEDYEIIIVDDGSIDNSYQVAKSLANKDYKIHVIHKENEGVSVARNVGIENANGKWIMFADPDDTLESTLISELLSATDEAIDIVACCCNALSDDIYEVDNFFSTDIRFITEIDKKDLYKQLMDGHYGQPGMVCTAIGVPWGKLYRSSFLKRKGLKFNSRLKRYQDNIFNMYAFAYAKEIQYINKPLYNYRLEHIQKYIHMYKPGFLEYMNALCEERYICMNRLGLLADSELREFYCTEMFKHLWSIFRNGIFTSENVISFKEKKIQASMLCQEECFSLLLKWNTKDLTFKDKIKLCIVKNQLFGALPIIFRLSDKKV